MYVLLCSNKCNIRMYVLSFTIGGILECMYYRL